MIGYRPSRRSAASGSRTLSPEASDTARGGSSWHGRSRSFNRGAAANPRPSAESILIAVVQQSGCWYATRKCSISVA